MTFFPQLKTQYKAFKKLFLNKLLAQNLSLFLFEK